MPPSVSTISRVARSSSARCIASGAAVVGETSGQVRSIRLAQPASGFAERIGDPTGRWGAVPFSVKEKLDTSHVVWKHHPRCGDYE